jgi:hypothetical protein
MMTIWGAGMAPPGVDRFTLTIGYRLNDRHATVWFRCARDCVMAAA